MSVGPAFFETMEIPLLLGRPIDSRDRDGAPVVAVINEVFAKKYFAGQNPLGRRFSLGNAVNVEFTVIGLARNSRYNSLKRDIPPVAFLSYLQDALSRPRLASFFTIRSGGSPSALEGTVRQIVREIAPGVPVTAMMTQTERMDNTISQERAFANLCSAFAMLALLIACVGLYGTMAYAVSWRTNEIGIRIALGAERRRIVWMVLREVLALAAAGVVIGLCGAWASLSAIQSFLFGLKAADPSTIFFAAAILVAALLLAGYLPAMRASQIDPLDALRHE
jgi:predicted permease